MKNYGLLLISLFLFACETNEQIMPPNLVRQAFVAVHPQIAGEKWSADADNYEVEFTEAGVEISETYTAAGSLLEREAEIPTNELPAAVLGAVAENFPNHQITEAARIDYPDGSVHYEAELTPGSGNKFDAIFLADGTLVKETTTQGNDDEEDDD